MFLIIEGVGIFRAKQEAQKLRAALWQPRVGTKEGAGDKEKHSPGFAPKPVWPHVHHCLPSPAFIYLECLCYMLFSAPKFLLAIADVTSKSPSWHLLWNKVGFLWGRVLQPCLLIDGSGILRDISVQRNCRLEFFSDSTEGSLKGSRVNLPAINISRWLLL